MTANPKQFNDRANEQELAAIDAELSHRPLQLDPAGYWILYLDRAEMLICAKHFGNQINAQGLAVDPVSGRVIPAKGKVERQASQLFRAKTAKQLCVQIFEQSGVELVSMLDHAAYLGREAQKAELALIHGIEYIQD
ncbi:MAG: DUF4346 domain-containing protein [Pseudanabaenaceae cyanobacterium bins.68]|nr:DUF4346 domain-containing protein [Pseudanabaenaceae cyanobacterium bins.68]